MESIGNETAIVKTDYSTDHMLAEYAAEIRRRGKRIKEDVVEIGRLLDFSRQRIGRGDWLKWLKVEFSWSDQTAYNFIHLYETHQDPGKFQIIWNSNLPVTALFQLTKPNTPNEALQQVAEHIEAGETPSCAEVAEIIAEAKTGGADSDPDRTEEAEADDVEDPGTAAHRAAMGRIAAEAGNNGQAHDDGNDHADDAGKSEPETLEAHWYRATVEERRALLDVIGVEGILEVMSSAFGKDLRERVPAPKKRKSITIPTHSASRGNGSRHRAGKARPASSACLKPQSRSKQRNRTAPPTRPSAGGARRRDEHQGCDRGEVPR
jgi:Protein of unknown function (DUF3102)